MASAEPVALARVADGGVDHRLLVARRVIGQQVGVPVQRLPEARDVAVAEDAEAAGEEALARAVALDVLGGQEADERLGHRQSHTVLLAAAVIGTRGSSSSPSHVARIHACAGSSVKRHARSPGPAITLR